jgi:hypothetical protein
MTPLLSQYPLPAGCTLRYFRDGDEEGMLDVLERAFDGWPKVELSVRPIEHLRWKLRSHEVALRSHIVAVLDGRIIAVRPLWAARVKVDDRVLLGRQPIDRAVLPAFQNQQMMPAMEARMPSAWAERFDVTLSLRISWQRLNLTPGHAHRRTIDIVARSLSIPPPPEAQVDWTLPRVETFDERFDDFWSEASRPYRMIVARTKEYLNYRYADRRAGNYSIVLAEAGGQVLGYIISTASQGIGRIADVLVLPQRLDVLESLLADAVRRLRDEGKTSLECWRFAYHPYAATLDKLGFDEPKRAKGINFKSLKGLDEEIAFFVDPKSAVHIMAGDTDLV